MTLVYLAGAWALGIWLARVAWSAGWMTCNTPGPLAWASLLLLPLIGLLLGRGNPRVRWPASLVLFLLLGGLRYQWQPFQPCLTADDLAFYNGTAEQPVWATVTGTVVRPPEERDTRMRIRLQAETVTLLHEEQPQAVDGAALFTVKRFPSLHYGDRVAVYGRLEAPPVFEGFNYKEYLARQGVHTLIQQPKVTLLAHGYGNWFWQRLYKLRERGRGIIARLLPEPEAALLTGILLGVESGIDRDLYDQFNKTGVSHIIVISGFNITIIAGLLTATLGRLVGRRRAFYPVIVGIILYTLLVGADAAVTRAAIMGGLVAWAAYLGRRSTAIVSLFLAGLVMTLLNPLALWDVGFQLSFMATLSLVLFTPPLTRHFEHLVGRLLPRGVAQSILNFLNDALIVTLAAQVLTLPLVTYYFGRVSIVSPLTNLLVLPVQPYVMIWGGVAVIIGLAADLVRPFVASAAPFIWFLARLVTWIPWLCLHWTVAVVKALAPLPFAAVKIRVGLPALWGYYGLLAAGMTSSRPSVPLLGTALQRLRSWLTASAATSVALAALLVTGSLWLAAWRSLPDGRLHVHFLAVDRGEAVLIETPDGQQVLVDGGYSPTALLTALGEELPFYDHQIELVVLTHPGDERVGGLAGLPDRYRIQQVLQAPFPYPSTAYESWLRALQDNGIPVIHAEAGMRVLLGYGIALDVLYPGPEPVLKKSGELDVKANSLVLRLSWGDTSFLLLGDVDKHTQEGLVARGLVQPTSVVKLPDSGRLQAFSQSLLDAAQPQYAVAFVQGEDRFRKLAASVEEAWVTAVGADHFYRTDLVGTVSFVSDGRSLSVVKQ